MSDRKLQGENVASVDPQVRDSAAELARFASTLRYEDVPEEARRTARACLIDAVACAIFGSGFPWSRMVVDASMLPDGPCAVPGTSIRTTPDKAALLAGVFTHAFELDSLRKPGAGVHPGATVALPALFMANERRASGRDLVTAIVAGCEVMFRLGAATLHTAEKRGFHAPGITGVFGSAVAAGKLSGLGERQMSNAFGLAGSMSGGILAFVGSGTGGMVKRLHLGRAAESGINAARLAAAGFEAPENIFETHFGVLETFCAETNPALLTQGLGQNWEIEKTCIKRYACHVSAQAAVELMAAWMKEHGLRADGIERIEIDAPEKIAHNHAAKHPGDMALAQYSVPFMLAFSMIHDLSDPFSLTDETIADPRVHALADHIHLAADPNLKGWSLRIKVRLRDGRALEGNASSFAGAPDRPLSEEQLYQRFKTLTARRPEAEMEALFHKLRSIEAQEIVELSK